MADKKKKVKAVADRVKEPQAAYESEQAEEAALHAMYEKGAFKPVSAAR